MFIIRPDGNYLDFYNRFCYYLSNARISIIEEKEIQFTSEDILKYFYYKFSDYVDYMTAGASRCIFVGSEREDLEATIIEIKDRLRDEFGVDKRCLRNLIHSSQTGTELFLQKHLFGEKYFQPPYVKGKDYHIQVSKAVDIPRIINILEECRLNSAILDVKIDELDVAIDILRKTKPPIVPLGLSVSKIIMCETCSYELIWFIEPKALISQMQKTPVSPLDLKSISYNIGLGKVDFEHKSKRIIANTKEEYIEKSSLKFLSIYRPLLQTICIDAIQMDSPLFSIEEMEFRGDIALDFGFKVFGGSSIPSMIGKFAYQYCYDMLEEVELRSIDV